MENQRFRERVWAKLDVLIDAQFALSTGVHVVLAKTDAGWQVVKDPKTLELVVQTDPTGATWKIVTERPDGKSLKDMLDRALGSPTQHHEHSGPDGDDIPIKTIVHQHLP